MSRAAVENRHFVAIHLDDDVVHAEADERGQKMLDGRAKRAMAVPDNRSEIGVADRSRARTDDTMRLAVVAHAREQDAGVGIRGKQRHPGRRSAMNPATHEVDSLRQSGL